MSEENDWGWLTELIRELIRSWPEPEGGDNTSPPTEGSGNDDQAQEHPHNGS